MMTERATPTDEPDDAARLLTHDPHTGLPNRFLLSDRLEVAVAQAQRFEHLAARSSSTSTRRPRCAPPSGSTSAKS